MNELPPSLRRLIDEMEPDSDTEFEDFGGAMQIACTKCGTPVDIQDMPQPQIMNTPGASLILVEHPKQGFCLNCKLPVAVALRGANLMLHAVPVAPPAQQPIILAPGMPKRVQDESPHSQTAVGHFD